MAAPMTNRDPWAEQSAKYVGDNGLVDRWLANISSGTGDPGYEGLVKSHPMVNADVAKKNLLSYALMKYGLEDQRGAADIYDQLRRAYAGRQQQSQASAAYVPNTASTTGITLPFPA